MELAMFLRDWAWDRYLWMEGRASQGKGREELKCRPCGGSHGVCVSWNCPQSVVLSWVESSQPYNPSSRDDGPSRKRHLGDSSQKNSKILKVG